MPIVSVLTLDIVVHKELRYATRLRCFSPRDIVSSYEHYIMGGARIGGLMCLRRSVFSGILLSMSVPSPNIHSK